MEFLYLIFYACLRLQFLYVETNPGLRCPVPTVCRLLFSNVRGLSRNLSNLTIASSQYDILLCSETLVSDMCHASELLVERSLRLVPGQDASIPRDGGIHTSWVWSISPTQIWVWLRNAGFYGLWCETELSSVSLYHNPVLSLYHNPDLDDWIFDCLLTSFSTVLAEDVRDSLLFVGDLHGHHQESLGSSTTICHGIAAFDFATVSCCGQLVVGHSHWWNTWPPDDWCSWPSTGFCCSTHR